MRGDIFLEYWVFVESELLLGRLLMSNDNKNSDFLSEMAGVRPIKQDKVHQLKKPGEDINTPYRQKIAESFARKDKNFLTDGEVPPVEPEEILEFKLDGVQPGVYKKLRQGKYGFDFHLDLHRKTVAEARNEVYHLLRTANSLNRRVLLITHGKGIMSTPPARLKSYVNYWLRQVDVVIAFHSAQPNHGGAGSVYVLLKKPSKEDSFYRNKFD
ncbi:DNA endonuclease SmrA [Aliikangiella sp. G2MR2-5]|uniref:DNA endonuclease SmrA n=1 Tax=Aliikangiella sp. G2MR2-5 TaxID=2788943 RepID=UPI001FF07A6B|nr:DNA endonuclease SmrA [Aliikangiella sp. G2MR2-5]